MTKPTLELPQYIPEFKTFDIKAVKESKYNGVEGIFIEGQPSTYDEDREGETMDAKAYDNPTVADYLKNPILLYHHGLDKAIGTKALGTIVEWKMLNNGPWVKAFVPKPSWEPMLDIYNNIKAGVLKSFSVGGIFEKVKRAGKTIISKVHLFEISVEPVQANQNALFTVASKAFDWLKDAKAVEDHHMSEAFDMQEMNSQMWRATETMHDVVRNIVKDTSLDAFGRQQALNNVMDEFRAIMTKIMAGAKTIDFEALESKWETGATQAGTKAGAMLSKANMGDMTASLDEMQAAMARLQAIINKAQAAKE